MVYDQHARSRSVLTAHGLIGVNSISAMTDDEHVSCMQRFFAGANDLSSFLRAMVEPPMARHPSRGPTPEDSAPQSLQVAPAGGGARVMK